MREFWIQYHATLGNFCTALFRVISRGRWGAEGDGQAYSDRTYLFAASFPDEAAMFAYCFTPIHADGPEQINLDLPEASVNTDWMEAAFEDQIIPRAAEYFSPKARRRIIRRLRGENTLIMIPTAAFDGMAFRLHSTGRLRYIGFEKSLAPAVSAIL